MNPVSPIDRIGVGIDTARYGHRVVFLRPDLKPLIRALTVTEDRAGYQELEQCLVLLHQQHPLARFHIRIDAAGQYATNLDCFLRGVDLPITLSIGEPKRNKDYRKAHFPKSKNDDVEAQAMARFALVELPAPTPAAPPAMTVLREVAGRLQADVKQSTQAINRLHNLLARVFPELAKVASDFAAGWVLRLLDEYPTAQRIGKARLASLKKIPYLSAEVAETIHRVAQQSIASLNGDVVETLVRDLVARVRETQRAEERMRKLLVDVFEQLPASPHLQVETVFGIGKATAAVLVASVVDIRRFATPESLVGYFGTFPEEHQSGVDKQGNPVPPGTMHMSTKGNDLARSYLWNATRSAIVHNPPVAALYRRLRAKGKRGDVAFGHCMRKLLHLVFAVWTSDRPFDKLYADRERPKEVVETIDAVAANEEAVGHKRDLPARTVVTTATDTVAPEPTPVKPHPKSARPRIDFAFLRQQVTMEQVLRHLGLRDGMRGRGLQQRGHCPIHGQPTDKHRTFSAHLGTHLFQCFDADCGAKGNVLDLWAAIHQLTPYEAALHLAETFQLPRNREEEQKRNP